MSIVDPLSYLASRLLPPARTFLFCAGLTVLTAGASGCGDDADALALATTSSSRAPDGDLPSPSLPAAQIIDSPAGDAPAAAASAPRAPLATVTVPTTTEAPKEAPWFRVYRPTDMKALGRPLPVVAWANGGCLRLELPWEPLFKRWAAAGMVVLALAASPQEGLLGAFATSNVANHRALIDWAIKQNESASSPYFGLLDLKALVAAGNSCGGVTALGVAAEEPRVNGVFVLSGSSALANTNRAIMGKIKAPVGYVVGGKEDIAAPNAQADYDAIGEGVPAMLISRAQGDHITVSSSPEVLVDVAKISLDWLDTALFRTPAALSRLRSPSVCTGCTSGTWNVKSKGL